VSIWVLHSPHCLILCPIKYYYLFVIFSCPMLGERSVWEIEKENMLKPRTTVAKSWNFTKCHWIHWTTGNDTSWNNFRRQFRFYLWRVTSSRFLAWSSKFHSHLFKLKFSPLGMSRKYDAYLRISYPLQSILNVLLKNYKTIANWQKAVDLLHTLLLLLLFLQKQHIK